MQCEWDGKRMIARHRRENEESESKFWLENYERKCRMCDECDEMKESEEDRMTVLN